MSAASITASAISSVMNSDQVSRNLDERKGLSNFVRLSFNDKNPMQFVVAKEKHVTQLVMLQVNLQAVSRPGVMFSDGNSTRTGAVHSVSPKIVRFDLVKQKDHFAVAPELRKFYQAEVLVPSPIPPHLIVFPSAQSKASETSRPMSEQSVFGTQPSIPVESEQASLGVSTYSEPPFYDCRYLESGEWSCECGSPDCVPPYTGQSSSGPTGFTPLRAPKIFESERTMLKAGK
jgi:hypothetical protein